jgi:hypothetical protein
MRSASALAATFALVGATLSGLPLTLWLLTLHPVAGLAAGVGLAVGVWGALHVIDRGQAWGWPGPGTQRPDQLRRLPPPDDLTAQVAPPSP